MSLLALLPFPSIAHDLGAIASLPFVWVLPETADATSLKGAYSHYYGVPPD